MQRLKKGKCWSCNRLRFLIDGGVCKKCHKSLSEVGKVYDISRQPIKLD